MGFFKSFFAGKEEVPAEEKQKNKNFEIFKYDGLRAQRMGRRDYAEKCFTEALALKADFETMGYLAQLYTQSNRQEEARTQLERMAEMEPKHLLTLLNLASVCFSLDDYPAMERAAKRAIEAAPDKAMPYYLLAKANQALGNDIMCIANLTKAVMQEESFAEARQARAEILFKMRQYKEAMEDIEYNLNNMEEDEAARLLRGQVYQATGETGKAEEDYRTVTELNPFNEQAFLLLGKLYIEQKRVPEAIALFDEAIEQNPHCAEAYHERGRARLMNGDKEGSMADMKQSLELNPQKTAALNGQYDNQPLGQQTDILGL